MQVVGKGRYNINAVVGLHNAGTRASDSGGGGSLVSSVMQTKGSQSIPDPTASPFAPHSADAAAGRFDIKYAQYSCEGHTRILMNSPICCYEK